MSPKNNFAAAAPGLVAFVGAGPGDARLLTLRGAELLARADTVVLDELTGPEFLRHCRPDVDVINAADLGQVDWAKTLIDAAATGKFVVRLVNGDPGLFGGAAEEAAACAASGIPFEIVPGVSAATAVPMHAGIPLTDAAPAEVRVVDATEVTDWEHVGAGAATLVILGAVGQTGQIAKALMAAGRPDTTPAALTTMGTTTEQATAVATLAKIASAAKGMEGSGVMVVGDVVRRRDELSWFESKPLFGWRVLVPRTKEQAASLSEQLRSYGAVPEEVPTISVEPPRTPQQMERAVKGVVTGRYEWIAFTSTNAVRAVRDKLAEYGLDARAFAGLKIAAVGEQTAAALRDFGVSPDLVPAGQQSSEGLLEVWPPYDADLDPINRVLLPRADIATDTLIAGLTEMGWECDDVTAYRTVRAAPPPAPIREAIKGGGFDAVLFTSSSTVRNLIGIAGKPHNVTVIAVIGPQTAKTAEEYGLRVHVRADKPSVSALAEGLAEYGAKRRAAQLEAGEPLRKPSQMRRGARRRK
ncbi:MAG TPA: uroporphyrinogen-III synthase [Streptosporangiaceae bacterium]|nr:uroporphyrinogen-III synthase [Streptosporangiaceae bacterium]